MIGKVIALIAAAALAGLAVLPAQAKMFPCVQALETASPTTGAPIEFSVHNATNEQKGLVWITYERGLRGYQLIEPGRTISQQSFVGNRWAILGTGNKCSFGIELEAGETSFEITE